MASNESNKEPAQFLAIPNANVHETLRQMEHALSQNFEWVGWQHSYDQDQSLFYINNRATAENFSWEPHPGKYNTVILLQPFYERLKELEPVVDLEHLALDHIQVSIKGIAGVNAQDSQLAKDYNQIIGILEDMDSFYNPKSLKDQILNGNEVITTREDLYYNHADDIVQAIYSFQRDETNTFNLHSIQLKGIFIEDTIINGIRTSDLEEKLKSVLDRCYMDDITEPHDKSLDKEIDAAYSLLENDEKGKLFAEKLRAKYEYLAGASKFETKQYFPAMPGFTLDHALNLFLGKDVYMPIPGEHAGQKAWFRLDASQKDKDGNAFLLRYGVQHNFSIQESLQALPIITNKHSVISIENLEKGYPVEADVMIDGNKQRVELAANPLNGNLKVFSINKADRGKELLVMSDTLVVDKALSYAYDSQLHRLPYSCDLVNDGSSLTTKDRIHKWMESDSSPGYNRHQRL